MVFMVLVVEVTTAERAGGVRDVMNQIGVVDGVIGVRSLRGSACGNVSMLVPLGKLWCFRRRLQMIVSVIDIGYKPAGVGVARSDIIVSCIINRRTVASVGMGSNTREWLDRRLGYQ